MSELTPLVQASHGAFFVMDEQDEAQDAPAARHATRTRSGSTSRTASGSARASSVRRALEKKSILLTSVPDDYIQVDVRASARRRR